MVSLVGTDWGDEGYCYIPKKVLAEAEPVAAGGRLVYRSDDSALERVRDVAGACAAYEVVLARWGKAPRSVSAKTARTRQAALHCGAARAAQGRIDQ